MLNCANCQQTNRRKDGNNKGRQRDYGKDCGYRHTVPYTHRGYSKEVKQLALKMYLEGLGFRSIARILNCSHVTVFHWIKRYGEKARLDIQTTETIAVVEMDEMHAYNACWVWIAVDRTVIAFFMLWSVRVRQKRDNACGKALPIMILTTS